MGNHSKVIGSFIGGVLGFAVAYLGLPEEFATPEVISSISALASAAATYLFPANDPS